MKIDRIDQHSKRYVIADIHGCYKTLRYLVEEMISPSKSDYLFFLGDYIDRGPNSSGVIDYVIDLIDNGYKVFPLRGNHEENLLKAYEEYDSDTFSFFVKKINKSVSLLDKNNKLKEKYYNIDEENSDFQQVQAEIITQTNSGIIVKDSTQLLHTFSELYSEFIQNGSISCNSVNTEQFSRKIQASNICSLIKEIC